jgi:hypothetical protein
MKSVLLILGLVVSIFASHAFAIDTRPRLLVLTDIGGDPDDQQSLVRLLVHANEFSIEGLIASASGTPGELKRAVVKPELIREQVDAYEKVFPNLIAHAAGFPAPDYLRSIIKSGNPQRGRAAVGDGHSTEGSQLIIDAANQPLKRPLNIVIWGGQTDLAQACWDVRREHGADGLQNFLSRIRIYDIANQDGLFEWMNEEFDFPFYILNTAQPGDDRRKAVFRGMYLGGDEALTSRAWIEKNVRTGHGPLGALYPAQTWTAPNTHSALKEGDTPSFLYFLPNGLNVPELPNYGGWGGRFQMIDGVWRDDTDTVAGVTDGRTTVSRWRRAVQNQFEARMDWSLNAVNSANHAPMPFVNGSSRHIIHVSGREGETIKLLANASIDPDGDELSFHWWRYGEPGTYQGELTLLGADKPAAELRVPKVEQSRTVHIILEVTDQGEPELTSFRRIVVEFLPDR